MTGRQSTLPKPETTRPPNLAGDLDRLDLWIGLLAAVASLAAYGLTTAPSVAAGDIAEMQFLPARLGIPHPNGYPLYILLGWLWSWLPLDTLAWRMNLLSAVLGAACVGLLYLLLRTAGLRRMSALAGGLAWAFQRPFWIYAGLALLPLLLFAYIPLRGNALWAASPFDQVYGAPLAVLQGVIHPRFAPDAATLWRYFTAGSPSSLDEVLSQAAANTWFMPELVQQEVGAVWLALGLGGLLLALWRDRAWGVALWILLLADILLAFYYRQGNVEAYFMPAALAWLAWPRGSTRRSAWRPGRGRAVGWQPAWAWPRWPCRWPSCCATLRPPTTAPSWPWIATGARCWPWTWNRAPGWWPTGAT